MRWTEKNKKLADRIIKRLGATVSPAALSHILQRHLKVPVTTAEARELLTELRPAVPQTSTKLLPVPVRRQNIKEQCRVLVNEVKTEIAAEKVLAIPSALTAEGISPILCLSDLHFGEVIEVNGLQTFNVEIAKERFDSVIDKAIETRELDCYEVDEFIVLLAGDIIDGELIYPGHAFETDGDAYKQLQIAIKHIWKGLVRLSEVFGVVRVHCVAGNHGRASRLHSQMSNWDNVLYLSLQLMASIQTKYDIEVHVPHQMWTDFNVRDWRVHSRHIGVTQAATAGPGRKVMTWLDQHDAQLFFYGHYHNPEMYSSGYRRIFKNGSLPPANDFAERLGFQSSCGQWLIGVTDAESVAFSKTLIPDIIDV